MTGPKSAAFALAMKVTSILNILKELLNCKSESGYIDCLNPDDIDCMVYCILTQ